MQTHRAHTPRTRSVIWLFVPALAGCNGCEPDQELPHLLEAEDATPVSVWVEEGVGLSPVDVTLFATTALGAPVSDGDIALTSEASAAPVVTPSADGWASVAVTGAETGAYNLTATVGAASGTQTTWLVGSDVGLVDTPAFDAVGEPTLMTGAGRGIAWCVGGEIWWNDFAGGAPIRVLALPEEVTDLYSTQVDSDGVSDLVVVSAAHLILLRGRDEGGLTWGGGWAPVADHTLRGASVADVDGDALSDISVAIGSGSGTTLLQLAGDGVWGFVASDSLELDYEVYAISAADLDNDGVGEVTFVTEDGLLRRYTKIEDSWAATMSGSEFDVDMAAGAHLVPSDDLTGDGIKDFIAYGPSLTTGTWLAWVITVGAETPARYPLVGELAAAEWLGFAVGDLNADGVTDLVYGTPTTFARGIWQDTGLFETSTFSVAKFTSVPTSRALAVLDGDGDGVMDVAIGGETVRLLAGEIDAEDTASWSPRIGSADVYGIDLLVEPEVGDVSGDLVTDLVALVLPSGGDVGVALQGLLGIAATEAADESLRSGGSVTLTNSGTAIDLAVCGNRAYALYEAADESGGLDTWLVRADIAAGMGPTLDGAPVVVTGTLLACGNFELGEVAVADLDGAISYVDAAGTVNAGESLGALGSVAGWDPDGDGVDELASCADAGCWVGAADVDGDGAADLVVQGVDGTELTLAAGTLSGSWAGTVRVDDADGDGVADLLVGDRGAVSVHRVVDGAVSPGVASWTWRPVADHARYGDLSGDGVPDLFLFGEDADPASTPSGDDWIGTLVYLRAAAGD